MTLVFQSDCLPVSYSLDDELTGATPKSVLELMDVKDLTLAHVKSHLQVNLPTPSYFSSYALQFTTPRSFNLL
jgi:hypothetical protein